MLRGCRWLSNQLGQLGFGLFSNFVLLLLGFFGLVQPELCCLYLFSCLLPFCLEFALLPFEFV